MATRRRQFGTVRKLPSGKHQARYIGPDGRRHTAPRTFPTRTDATRWLSAIQTDIDRGVWISPNLAGTGLSGYAERWIKDRRRSGRPLRPRTRETYQHSLDRWIRPAFGEIPLNRITPSAVSTWHSDVSVRGGATAARQAYAFLRAVLNTAVRDQILYRNPCNIPGAGQANSPERPLLSDDEVRRLIHAMPAHFRALLVLAFWAQLRPGELLGLERRDVDFGNGTLTIRRQVVEVNNRPVVGPTKWGSDRVLHLPDLALNALRGHLGGSPTRLPNARVFVRPDGSTLREHHVHYAVAKARKAAGLPAHARLYDLRHAGLTAAAQEGASIKEVMRRAGHSTTRAAMIYQHAADSRDAELASRLSDRAGRGDWATSP